MRVMKSKAVALLAAAILTLAACGSGVANPADPVGNWNVTYGSPTTVAITNSGGTYTITATAAVQVIGSRCFVPTGTVLATFFRGSGDSYVGQHGLWWTHDCTFDRQAPVTFSLSAGGQKLTLIGSVGAPVVYTRAAVSAASPIDVTLLLAILALLVVAGLAAFLVLRRRRRA